MTITKESVDNRYEVGVLAKALRLLDLFASGQRYSLAEICHHLDLNKTTAFRLAATLEQYGYLQKSPQDRRYSLGPKVLGLEGVVRRTEPLRWKALAPLEDLSRQVRETAHVGVLYGGQAVTVQLAEGTHSLRMHTWVGKRMPAHCSALGKVLLAWAGEEAAREYIRRYGLTPKTPNTITQPEEFLTHLRQVRAQRYAIDNQELEQDLYCIAVPILLNEDRAFAALVVSGPAPRLAPNTSNILPLMHATAETISKEVISGLEHLT